MTRQVSTPDLRADSECDKTSVSGRSSCLELIPACPAMEVNRPCKAETQPVKPIDLLQKRPTNPRFSFLPHKVGPCGEQTPRRRCALRRFLWLFQSGQYSPLWYSLFCASGLTTQYGDIRQVRLGYQIHQDIANWLLNGAPRIYDKSDLKRPNFQHIEIPPILVRYFATNSASNRSASSLTHIAPHLHDTWPLPRQNTAKLNVKRSRWPACPTQRQAPSTPAVSSSAWHCA